MPRAGTAPTCDTAGVIQPIISSIAAIQASEALKFLTGNLGELHGSLIQIDLWQNEWRKIKLGLSGENCPACGLRNFDALDAEQNEFSAVLCGRDAVQIAPPRAAEIDLESLAEIWKPLGDVKLNEYLARLTTGEHEITVFRDARAIIRGTDDIPTARSLYSRFIGI
jgi:adenylyltransferase/sulfurtransferase